ncbi:MAG: hypothetical protein A3E84_05535 [Gammaproteobacteria bacterium RIFCSPHIGHO2_12_FULL_42_13]|nr:MAG: hypothetical protein A3E84_05535 [Gammaproteobacteria bacterium RIFCSPHIGHO2_12_FULL_42_13]
MADADPQNPSVNEWSFAESRSAPQNPSVSEWFFAGSAESLCKRPLTNVRVLWIQDSGQMEARA